MKTKEEILAKRIVKFPEDPFDVNALEPMTDTSIKKNVYFAMDEYAKQQAIAFLKWAINAALQGDHYGGVEFSIPDGPDNAEEAYSQFTEYQSLNK